MNAKFLRPLAIGLSVALLVMAADQLSKWGILKALAGSERLELLPILDFVLHWNTGVSYSLGAGLGSNSPLIFILGPALIVGFLVVWLAKAEGRWVLFALGLVIGGAIGNMADRLRFGAVEDFIYLHFGSFGPFGAFNVADAAISLGATILVFESLFTKRTSLKNRP